MTKIAVQIDNVHIYKSGKKKYVYYRTDKVNIRIRRDVDDIEGIKEEAARIKKEIAETGSAGARSYAPGTLGNLIDRYKSDPDWWPENLATRKSYQRAFNTLQAFGFFSAKTETFTLPKIIKIRDEVVFPKHKRWMANYVVTVLSVVFDFAHHRNMITVNPLAERVRKRRKPKGAAKVNRAWTAEERSAVLAKAPDHIYIALALAMCTGLRKADLFSATTSAIKGEEIVVRTSKRDKLAKIPIHSLLRAALEKREAIVKANPKKAAPVQICIGRYGAPYSAEGFDTVWQRFRTKLEKDGDIGPGLTIHGLRHTFGTMLIEAGMDPDHVRRLLTHSSMSQTAEYTEAAELPTAAKAKVINLKIDGQKR